MMNVEQLIERAQKGRLGKLFFAELFRMYHQKMYTELEQVLFSCPEPERTVNWQCLYAKCLLNQNHYQDALAILLELPTSLKQTIIQDLLTCYEHLGLFDEGIALIEEQQSLTWQLSLELKKINFLKLSGRHDLALSSIESAVSDHSEHQELIVTHVNYLSFINHPRLAEILKQYIKAHPENIQLLMLEFWHTYHHLDKTCAYNLLMIIIHTFPVYVDAHLALIQINLMDGLVNEAKLHQLAFSDKFKSEERALILLTELVEKYPCLSLGITHAYPVKVSLPQLVKTVFDVLKVPGTVTYLVGSSIHHILEERQLHEVADIDFVSNQPPLPTTGFRVNPYMPRLFTSYMDEGAISYKCECFINPLAAQEMIEIDVKNRDFTINSLYCDSDGNIIDPTGLGLLDFQYRIIRTIISSRFSIDDDPIRILRAIKLILKGFVAAPELEFALYHWLPNHALNQSHINAVTAKLLLSFADNPMPLIELLKRYQLFEKMFGIITLGANDSQLYDMLYTRVNTSSPKFKA